LLLLLLLALVLSETGRRRRLLLRSRFRIPPVVVAVFETPVRPRDDRHEPNAPSSVNGKPVIFRRRRRPAAETTTNPETPNERSPALPKHKAMWVSGGRRVWGNWTGLRSGLVVLATLLLSSVNNESVSE